MLMYPQSIINTERLVLSSPEYIYQIMSTIYDEEDNVNYDEKDLEERLLSRNDSLINLAIARYGHITDSVLHIFNNSVSSTFRIAAILNTKALWIDDKVLTNILSRNDKYELMALFRNHEAFEYYEANRFLQNLFEKKGVFKAIDMTLWRKCIKLTWNNPLISIFGGPTWYEKLTYHEGPDFSRIKMFEALYNLLIIVPNNEDWAKTLSMLYDEVKLPENFSMSEDEFRSLLKRWHSFASSELKSSNSFLEVRRHITNLYCLNISPKYGHYSSDEFLALQNDPDIAVRMGFYQNCKCSTIKMQSYYERDKKYFVEAAVMNPFFHAIEKNKYMLRDIYYNEYHDSMSDGEEYFYRNRLELMYDWVFSNEEYNAELRQQRSYPKTPHYGFKDQINDQMYKIQNLITICIILNIVTIVALIILYFFKI